MFPNCRMSCLGCYREGWEGVSLVRGRRASTTELGAGDWTRPSSTILPWTLVSHWSWAIKKSVPWSSDLISSVILPYRSFISSLPTGGSTVCPSPSHLSKEKADIDLFIQAQLGRPLNPLSHPPCTRIWVWINLSSSRSSASPLSPFPGLSRPSLHCLFSNWISFNIFFLVEKVFALSLVLNVLIVSFILGNTSLI